MSDWIHAFLQSSYSTRCSLHPIPRNDKDHFCINCQTSLCQFCIEGGMHLQHKVIKIYKHVYNDVVSLTAMEKHMDCSLIQTYRSNKRLVIALNALPHSGSAPRPNTKGCQTCQRRIAQPDTFHYCSISCQVASLSRGSSSNVAAATVADPPPPPPPSTSVAEGNWGWQGSGSRTPRRRRTRIGKPFSTPFF